MTYRLPSRYLPPSRYRYPYYRGYRRAGGPGKATVLIAAVVLALAASGGAKAALPGVRHHAAPRTAPVPGGSETAFITAILADLGAPATKANTASLAAWFTREWPSWPPGAANNPLDSTQPAPGSATFNSVGVQDYPDAAEGARENAVTIANGYYPGILAALRSGAGLCGNPSLAGEFQTWSGNGYSGVC